ncbi:MAG: TetR family transcriptional regulator [Burkholderiaceae bacterium]
MPPASKKKAAEVPLAQQRREQILAAARECVRRHGFHAASMSEIARSFGMSAGHIYNYFDSKEAIIAALVAQDLAHFNEMVEELRGTGDIRFALIDQAHHGVARKMDRDRSRLGMEILAEGARNPKIDDMLQAADSAARDRLRELLGTIASPDMTASELDARVDVLMALFDGLMIRSLRAQTADQAALVRVIQRCLVTLTDRNPI